MVDQTELERRVDQVARRQALLETRQSIVTSLKETAGQTNSAARALLPARGPKSPRPGRSRSATPFA